MLVDIVRLSGWEKIRFRWIFQVEGSVAMQPIILGTCDIPSFSSQVLQQRPVSGCCLFLNSADFVLLGHTSTKKFVLNVLMSFKTWTQSLM